MQTSRSNVTLCRWSVTCLLLTMSRSSLVRSLFVRVDFERGESCAEIDTVLIENVPRSADSYSVQSSEALSKVYLGLRAQHSTVDYRCQMLCDCLGWKKNSCSLPQCLPNSRLLQGSMCGQLESDTGQTMPRAFGHRLCARWFHRNRA